jgi:cytochrome P450
VATSPRSSEFDPSAAVIDDDPDSWYAPLRASGPVHRLDANWVVLSRYADVAQALHDSRFSRRQLGVGSHRATEVPDPATTAMLDLDPPAHTRLRRLVGRVFTKGYVEDLRISIDAHFSRLLAAMSDQEPCDLMTCLAVPLPFAVMSDVFDVPPDDRPALQAWLRTISGSQEHTDDAQAVEAALHAIRSMDAYVRALMVERRGGVGHDLLTKMLQVELDGDRLAPDEVVMMARLIYIAGLDTTTSFLGNALLALLTESDGVDQWRRGGAGASNAIDELLRFDTPVQFVARTVVEPVEMGGHRLAPGTGVLALLGSANHDPGEFVEPGRLWLGRRNANRHLGFGAGIHRCLGAGLARLAGEVVIGGLLDSYPTISLAGTIVRSERVTLRGLVSLPVHLGGSRAR